MEAGIGTIFCIDVMGTISNSMEVQTVECLPARSFERWLNCIKLGINHGIG